MPDIDLDDPASYSSLDPDDMYRRVNDLAVQMADAWALSQAMALPEDLGRVQNVVVAGMGGSAIGGSLLEAYAAADMPIPISVWRGYGLPQYVNRRSLVIIASYSGNTEETLSAMNEAHSRGSRLIAVTTGGRVLQQATDWSVPTLTFSYDAQPRATLGYLFTPLVGIVARLGFLPDQEALMREAIARVRSVRNEWSGEVPRTQNPAKQMARAAFGKVVVVYGSEFLAAVARRWKTQVNENSKQWAFFEEFSELNHNAIVGYGYPSNLSERMQVFVLDSPQLSHRIRLRMQVTGRLLDQFGVPHQTVSGSGTGRLAQIFTLISLGDYVSYYLALLNGADPTEIKPIDFLKTELSRTQ
jgi:glucose/mannose-6-phosphate isomerase